MKLIEILKENVFIKPHFDNTISKEDRLKYREIISKKIGIKSREIIIHRISNDNRWIEFIHRIDWERNRSKPQKVVFYEYDNLKDKIVKK